MGLRKKKLELSNDERLIELEENQLEFRRTFNTTIVGAFSFVAGLLWRDVITAFIELFPQLNGLLGKLVSAVVFTTIIVAVIMVINSKTSKLEMKLEKAKEEFDQKDVEPES